MSKHNFLCLMLLVFFQGISASEKEDSLVVHFDIKFGKETLELDKNYVSQNNETLQITGLKFYVSGIQIQFSDGSVVKSDAYHLINLEKPETCHIAFCPISKKQVASVAFNVGVDSLASISGSMAGDLDPTNGMYWAWQSGYINMKIEGISPSCKTRKNEFQFHIGGYLKPNYAMCSIKLAAKSEAHIIVDISDFFSALKLSETNNVVTPGKDAMHLADLTARMFHSE